MTEVTAAPAAAPVPVAETVETLSQFCTRLSHTDKRIEHLAAFFATMKAEGKSSMTRAQWEAELSAYSTRVVV